MYAKARAVQLLKDWACLQIKVVVLVVGGGFQWGYEDDDDGDKAGV